MQKHWVWLATRSGIGVRGRAELLRRFGTAERIYAMDRAALQAEEGLRQSWLEPQLDKSLDGAERILAQCDRFDIRLLTYAEPAYPERLRNIADPPALLYYQGRLPDFDHEAAIAVVGSRRCSAYGLLHAKQFSRLIAASGGLVMSGGARGIDTMALQSAMDLPEPVVCVLACGLDIAYPPENGQLFAQIASRGCLLSEYPPGTSPMRGNFPVRNRILSGLSVGVLVVEASAQSGALITARLALEQGRDVFAIPGNLGVAACEGTNRLLREGALMPENGWELLQEYTHLFPGKLADGRRREVMEQRFGSHYAAAVPAQPLPERPANPARPAKLGAAFLSRKMRLRPCTNGTRTHFCVSLVASEGRRPQTVTGLREGLMISLQSRSPRSRPWMRISAVATLVAMGMLYWSHRWVI